MTFIKELYLKIIAFGSILQPVLLLAIRLYWGYSFFEGGLGKLEDIQPVANLFRTLGIPLPLVNAYIVGSIECVGGICLMAGFAARLAAIPLAVVMSVALLTAHSDAFQSILSNPYELLQQTPFTYLIASLIVLAFGPGAIAIDAFLKKYVFKISS